VRSGLQPGGKQSQRLHSHGPRLRSGPCPLAPGLDERGLAGHPRLRL
jgi:hypothetical protein